MKLCPLCVGNILKDFTVDNMKKTGLYGYMYDFLLIVILLILAIFWIFVNI